VSEIDTVFILALRSRREAGYKRVWFGSRPRSWTTANRNGSSWSWRITLVACHCARPRAATGGTGSDAFKNFVGIPQDQLLERLLELTLYTEENLR